jgi:hypothetical protein
LIPATDYGPLVIGFLSLDLKSRVDHPEYNGQLSNARKPKPETSMVIPK